MRETRQRWAYVALAGVGGAVAAGLMLSTVVRAQGDDAPAEPAASDEADTPRVVINRRSAGLEHYPCSQCHDKIELREPTDPPRRPHDDMTLQHMPGIEMCVQCHTPDDMDSLRLMTGEKLHFDESDRVCGQCHPEKHADWRLGIHGKVAGSWRTVRIRYTCADCHPPHDPAYRHTETLPPPEFPKFGIPKD